MTRVYPYEDGVNVHRVTASVLLGSAAASIDLPDLPPNASTVRAVCMMRTDRAGQATDGVNLAFNGDTTATNYEWQRLTGTTTTASSLYTNDARNIARVPGASATANQFGIFEVVIPLYANTVTTKVAQAVGISPDTAGSVMHASVYGLHWQSTAAIDQLTFTPVNGTNFIAGSSVELYLE